MTNQTDVTRTQQQGLPPGEFLGHPKALWQLFNVEMWERFAYYGMRAVLAVYVATTFFSHLGAEANSAASLVYGGYTALVYATGIAGGYIADKILGYQRSILLGAIIMAAGLFVLLIEDLNWFLVGLALIVSGHGGIKGDNPWSKAGWNLTKQGAYAKEHGVEKAQDAAKSAGSAFGATHPPAE